MPEDAPNRSQLREVSNAEAGQSAAINALCPTLIAIPFFIVSDYCISSVVPVL
jgi:hypothetical protein